MMYIIQSRVNYCLKMTGMSNIEKFLPHWLCSGSPLGSQLVKTHSRRMGDTGSGLHQCSLLPVKHNTHHNTKINNLKNK